jgi:hypothetical protein
MRLLKPFTVLMSAFLPAIVAAQSFEIENPLGVKDLGQAIQKIAGQLERLAIPVAAVLYIYAGFLYLTAGAKPENIQKAKKALLYTTIGLVVIFIGGGFVDLIRSILNLGQ